MGRSVKAVRSSAVLLLLVSSCLGTRAPAEDPAPKREAAETKRLERLREEALRNVAELPDEGYCLAGRSCAERPEFHGPPACLVAGELAVCDSRGTVELAK